VDPKRRPKKQDGSWRKKRSDARKGPVEANRMSVDEARALDKASKMGWQQWEKKVDGALRVNGWYWWRDRVLPKRFGEEAQRVGRKAGLPDRLVAKTFFHVYELPLPLRSLLGPVVLKSPGEGFCVVGFIECKTGSARLTGEQERWLEIAHLTPGMFGYVARPERYDELVALLGGEYGL
jgi:hypothetical protein